MADGKITDEQAAAIRSDKRKNTVIAAEYGVSDKSISLIKNGLLHRADPGKPVRPAGVRRPNAQQIEAICRDKRRARVIAAEYGFTVRMIYDVKLGRIQAPLPPTPRVKRDPYYRVDWSAYGP